ncbi:MAG: GNAT family N-acetyltransferase [Verrucomicrobiota bacterium]
MIELRQIRETDFNEVAELIFLSTNSWYQQHLGRAAFTGTPADCLAFCETYHDLDPEAAIVAENIHSDRIVGSCFVHPRETHLSIGIVNVHPNYFSAGVAGKMLRAVIKEADDADLPMRLVSSALNLDSYSLYHRYGFRPYATFQDMVLEVPKSGIPSQELSEAASKVKIREATPSDLIAMGKLEFEVAGISRERDYCFFIENESGIWHTVIAESADGEPLGFLSSIAAPGVSMIGPGVSQTEAAAEALLLSQINQFAGATAYFLIPVETTSLADAAYRWKARNCELHFGQVRGDAQPLAGVMFPSFLPESA